MVPRWLDADLLCLCVVSPETLPKPLPLSMYTSIFSLSSVSLNSPLLASLHDHIACLRCTAVIWHNHRKACFYVATYTQRLSCIKKSILYRAQRSILLGKLNPKLPDQTVLQPAYYLQWSEVILLLWCHEKLNP